MVGIKASPRHKKAPSVRRGLSSSVDLNFEGVPDQPIAGA